MKKEIHPKDYRLCVFKDMSNGYTFLTRSCAETKELLKWEDGNEYPLVKLDISMTSHPFYTGKQVLVDTAGRVDKFRTRFSKKKNFDAQEPTESKETESKEADTKEKE